MRLNPDRAIAVSAIIIALGGNAVGIAISSSVNEAKINFVKERQESYEAQYNSSLQVIRDDIKESKTELLQNLGGRLSRIESQLDEQRRSR